MSNYSNDLIFGIDKTERVVSIEHKDEEIILFIQTPSGKIETKTMPAIFWFITQNRVSSKQFELNGNQHYKYLAMFGTQKERDEIHRKIKGEGHDLYRIYDHKEQSMVIQGITYYKGMQPKEVSILSFDIEATTLVHNKDSKVLIISNTFRDHAGKITRKLFVYDQYENEGQMLEAWCDWVRKMDPSIICGHNIYGYDIPYITFCAKQSGVKIRLGRDNSEITFDKWDSGFRKDGSQDLEYRNCYIYGREILDTMFLSYKYDIGRQFESYGLKPIIKQLGMEKEGRTFIDAGDIRNLYKIPEKWKLIKQYAEEDADDSLKLFDKMVPAQFYFAQTVSKPFQAIINGATGSQMNNIMVRSYLQKEHSIAKASEVSGFEGAVSFGIPGIYRNAFKQDVVSLYPSIMRQYKIYNKEKDPEQNFSKLVDYFLLERIKNKKLAKETGEQYYNDLQESQKVGANSLYGFKGAPGLNYNNPDGAAEVTRRGREVLTKAILFATGKDVNYWKEKSEQSNS